MPSYRINCPNPSCAQPLNLPTEGIGLELSCPHCRAAIAVELGPDGQPVSTKVKKSAWGVPRRLIGPGFALVIFGVAGMFANGYIAQDCLLHPEAAREHADNFVRFFRQAEKTVGQKDESKQKTPDVTPLDQFAALAGQAARVAHEEEMHEARAAAGAPSVLPWNLGFFFVSAVVALGGLAILRGRMFWLAITGCAAACLNINFCCCLPGVLIGAWGFFVLVRDESRSFFAR